MGVDKGLLHGSHEVRLFSGRVHDAAEIDRSLPTSDPMATCATAYCPRCSSARSYVAQAGEGERRCRAEALTKFRRVDRDCEAVVKRKLVDEVMGS